MGARTLLSDPQLDGLAPGSTEWYRTQRRMIEERPLVRRTYARWYREMLADIASVPNPGAILEIGSGGGFLKEIEPSIITSDIVPGPCDLVVDARRLPFGDASLRGILLTHVFHHIPDVSDFLREALRTLVPGGVVSLVDVAHTPLSRLLFGNFDFEEYYLKERGDWTLDLDRGYDGANQALTYMIFKRDADLLEERFPQLKVECITYMPWFGYLASGGVTRRDLVPSMLVPLAAAFDTAATLANPLCALHWHVRLRKVK